MKYNKHRLMKVGRTVALVSGCSVPIEQAIRAALSSVGGTVFDVKLKEIDQQVVWRVKLVVAGHRVKVYVDARSGNVVNAKAEILASERVDRNSFPDRELEPIVGS